MGYPQRILLEEECVNQNGIFLPEEINVLMLVARRLCATLPDVGNPFSFGIGTRRFNQANCMPQLELVVNHEKISGPPDDRPEFYQEECLRMLQAAARPKDYLADIANLHDYYDKNEDALKNGAILQSDGKALASIKDDGGWFLLGLRFERLPSLESNIFAVVFLTSIAGTIFAMDEHNSRLRAAYNAFLTTCEAWNVAIPEARLGKWLKESSFKDFAYRHYAQHGPRKFFG